jgi:hypothetical protein
MKKSVISFELLYRGTDCKEWTHKGVHSRVDNRGATVSLMKIAQTGRRCGGFTSVSWGGNSDYKKDEYAFLFSLDTNTHYPVIDKEKAIWCTSDRGIMFGDCELRSYGEPYNEKGNGC